MSDTPVRVFPPGLRHGTRGTWWPSVYDDGRKAAIVCCPVCGKTRTIGDRVDASGNVTVPFWCDPGFCSFKETIRLAGWKPK